jgi:hypothetical protein
MTPLTKEKTFETRFTSPQSGITTCFDPDSVIRLQGCKLITRFMPIAQSDHVDTTPAQQQHELQLETSIQRKSVYYSTNLKPTAQLGLCNEHLS